MALSGIGQRSPKVCKTF